MVKRFNLDVKSAPIQVAEAPKRIKTIENPAIKNKALNMTARLADTDNGLGPSLVFNFWMEVPEINEM